MAISESGLSDFDDDLSFLDLEVEDDSDLPFLDDLEAEDDYGNAYDDDDE